MPRTARRSSIFCSANDESDPDEFTNESRKNTLTPKQEEYIQKVEKEKHDWKKYFNQLKATESRLETEEKNNSANTFDYVKFLNEDDVDLLKRCELYEQEYLKKYDLNELKLEINDIKEAVEGQKEEVNQILDANQIMLFKLSNSESDELETSHEIEYDSGIAVENIFSDSD